jgi:hypothetical protein
MSHVRALIARLRSRGLAVGLIAAVIVYSMVGTMLPQATTTTGGRNVGLWQQAHPVLAMFTRALGLHRAYSSPLFLLLLGVLAASTIACAWERTRLALRRFRASGRVSEGDARRLEKSPPIVIPLTSANEADAIDRAADALRRLRLRVRTGPKIVEASSTRLGLLGSPLFHWTLVALFAVILLGRLSRAEGILALPLGYPRQDIAAAYETVSHGPLYAGHSKLSLLLTDLGPYTDSGGVDRGVSPVVELLRDGRVLRRQRVYPNNPLRYGSLLIHANTDGLAVMMSVESSQAAQPLPERDMLRFDASPEGIASSRFDVQDASGAVRDAISVTVPLDRKGGQPRLAPPVVPRVVLSIRSGGVETTAVVVKGASTTLPTGEKVRLDDLVYFEAVSVADDWSIYPLYLLFALVSLTVSVAVLMPYRRVLVSTRVNDGARELVALPMHARGDPLFAEQIEQALRDAAAKDSPRGDDRRSEKEESA